MPSPLLPSIDKVYGLMRPYIPMDLDEYSEATREAMFLEAMRGLLTAPSIEAAIRFSAMAESLAKTISRDAAQRCIDTIDQELLAYRESVDQPKH